ncbi:hypothetical protein ES332_D07G221200v1 [Gossypium tomentosum]|uniref:Uncharacterized protein n=1 Tax=Gossypium tomentosum TaxID=34277 RepID=A0A5D2KB17_GOSTO|nr:hypothetical protein ES332_D07G221200v1 [Gossypium tomentosum]
MHEEKLVVTADLSSEEDMLYHKQWKQSNRLSLVFIKEYLMLVVESFHSMDKSLGILMAQLMTMKYDRLRRMQEYIIEMNNIAAWLKTLGMMVDDSFLV